MQSRNPPLERMRLDDPLHRKASRFAMVGSGRAWLASFAAFVLASLPTAPPTSAQPGKVYTVGLVTSGTRDQAAPFLSALEGALEKLGYVEGQNLASSIGSRAGTASGSPS